MRVYFNGASPLPSLNTQHSTLNINIDSVAKGLDHFPYHIGYTPNKLASNQIPITTNIDIIAR